MSDADKVDYDVIVIGGGGAGMAAAIQASDAGARVALLEAANKLGGATALAGGLFYAAGTAAQHELGITDTPEAMYQDILALNGDSVPQALVRQFCDDAPKVMNWLMELGVEFLPERLSAPSPRFVPRAHEPLGFGAKIAEQLELAVSKRPIDVARMSRVEKLLTDAQGAIIGVRVGDDEISARSVVLACGGFGASEEFISRLLPKARRAGDWVWNVGCSTSRGDGLRMAEAVGAPLVGENSALLLQSPNFHRNLEVIGPDWALMVNSLGKRFVREDGAYYEISEGIEAQPDSRAFCIFDRPMFETAKPHPRVLEAVKLGIATVSWVTRMLQEQLEEGRVIESPTIAGLAKKIGVDVASLTATVARYNQLAATGIDADLNKSTASLKPVATPAFYAVEVRPAALIVTGSGMPIDVKARVLDASGKALSGLYAAGETVGNLYGRHYVSSGYAIASSITFGCIAGRSAADYAKVQAAA
jgi:fumarate reductase flavoprotein subunit